MLCMRCPKVKIIFSMHYEINRIPIDLKCIYAILKLNFIFFHAKVGLQP